ECAETSWLLSRQMRSTPTRLKPRQRNRWLRAEDVEEGHLEAPVLEAPLAESPELSAARRSYLRGMIERDLGNSEAAERDLLAAADQSEPAAMFEVGMIARERGDARSSADWIGKAAEL